MCVYYNRYSYLFVCHLRFQPATPAKSSIFTQGRVAPSKLRRFVIFLAGAVGFQLIQAKG